MIFMRITLADVFEVDSTNNVNDIAVLYHYYTKAVTFNKN